MVTIVKCPKCGSTNLKLLTEFSLKCLECGFFIILSILSDARI